MTASSRYTRAISSEVGEIERRLRILQNGIENAAMPARRTRIGCLLAGVFVLSILDYGDAALPGPRIR